MDTVIFGININSIWNILISTIEFIFSELNTVLGLVFNEIGVVFNIITTLGYNFIPILAGIIFLSIYILQKRFYLQR